MELIIQNQGKKAIKTPPRRAFFKKIAGAGQPIFSKKESSADGFASGLQPYTTGALSQPELVHLLKRTMFGIKKSDLDHFKTLPLPQIVDELLTVSASPLPAVPDDYFSDTWQNQLKNALAAGQDPLGFQTMVPPPPVNDYEWSEWFGTYGSAAVDHQLHDLQVPPGKSWICSNFKGTAVPSLPAGDDGGNTVETWRQYSFNSWWTRQMIGQERSIREKMTLFWVNFFPAEWKIDQFLTNQYYWYNQMLRHGCLGDFRVLLKNVSTSPMMLMFLDGWKNTKDTPNQNYGRELQELYCIGQPPKNPQNPTVDSYSEQDVIEVSRILTGWGFEWTPPVLKSFFYPQFHDAGDKQLSAFYKSTKITGKTGAAGASELDELLALMFTLDAPSLNVARRAYRFFVTPNIDADTEATIIAPLAQILRDNDYQLRPMMAALLQSQHFFDLKLRGGMVKPPFDFVMGALRELQATLHNPGAGVNQARYQMEQGNALRQKVGSLGQGHFADAFGWKAYYYPPFFDKNWLNASSFAERKEYFNRALDSGVTRSSEVAGWIDDKNFEWQLRFDFPNFIRNNGFSMPSDAAALRDQLLAWLLPVELCAAGKGTLLAALQTPANNWASTWSAFSISPTNAATKTAVNDRLLTFFKALNAMEEYHLI